MYQVDIPNKFQVNIFLVMIEKIWAREDLYDTCTLRSLTLALIQGRKSLKQMILLGMHQNITFM